jgi:hypothetical protein
MMQLDRLTSSALRTSSYRFQNQSNLVVEDLHRKVKVLTFCTLVALAPVGQELTLRVEKWVMPMMMSRNFSNKWP